MDARLRLVQFSHGGETRVGVETADKGPVVDICRVNKAIPHDMRAFIKDWDNSVKMTLAAVDSASADQILQPGSFNLKAPIYDPPKLICIGMNYVDHCTEQNIPVPTEPLVFSKFPSSITEPDGAVLLSPETQSLDFEVELAFVISKSGKGIKESDAMNHVAGYTVAHDVSARDWQLKKNGGQWLIGKTFDTFCPLGPAIVTTPLLPDPHNLGIRCRLNGETVQNSNTCQLVHKTQALVAFISRFMTLEPGDVVLTGTPPGVGVFRSPPLYLKAGDIVECEIDGIGTIRNEIKNSVD